MKRRLIHLTGETSSGVAVEGRIRFFKVGSWAVGGLEKIAKTIGDITFVGFFHLDGVAEVIASQVLVLFVIPGTGIALDKSNNP